MADALIAPASGRPILRLPVRAGAPSLKPAADYCRAFVLRRARERAERHAARRALRRAELRAKAAELVAADRLACAGRV
ncbi:MAG: hypothetical protein RL456_617 [Pseudomonadota bacterium]|jgi:hypothetical protein